MQAAPTVEIKAPCRPPAATGLADRPAFVSRTARDVFEQADNLPDWRQIYWQLSCGQFSGATQTVEFDGIQLFREAMNQAVDQHGAAPSAHIVIGVPSNMNGQGYWGGRRIGESSVLTLGQCDDLKFRTPLQSDFTFMTIDARRLQQAALSYDIDDIDAVLDSLPRVADVAPDVAARFRTLLSMALQSAIPHRASPAYEYLRAELAEACVQTLCRSEKTVRYNSSQHVHRYLVNTVRERVLSDMLCPPTVDQLCKDLKVSHRTLHHAFTSVLDVNPVRYIRLVRLHRARQALKRATVAPGYISEIAADCGFWHLGMFAKYYKEVFGESPSDTAPPPYCSLRGQRTRPDKMKTDDDNRNKVPASSWSCSGRKASCSIV